MTYSWEFSNTAAGRVLKAIQLRGRASIKDVAVDLEVTPSAVRQHLVQLQASGAIRAEKVREGVGRPYHIYSLTPEAYNLFYQDYGDLARLLLEEVASSQGSDALQDVLHKVSDRLVAIYRGQIRGQDLADRLRDWASLLDQRGVTVKIVKTERGYVVEEYGCPYHNLAVENRAVCEMERQVMARLIESRVALTHCVLDGHRGCQFTVTSENVSFQ